MGTIFVPAMQIFHIYIYIYIYITRIARLHEWFSQDETSFHHIWIQGLINKTEFLDVLVNKDQNNVIQTTIYRKETGQQNSFDAQSEHPKLLKNSIPYSQALQLQQICLPQQESVHTTKMISQIKWTANW